MMISKIQPMLPMQTFKDKTKKASESVVVEREWKAPLENPAVKTGILGLLNKIGAKNQAPIREYNRLDGGYIDWYPDGTHKEYYQDGTLHREAFKNGDVIMYYRDGSVYSECTKNGEARYLKGYKKP